MNGAIKVDSFLDETAFAQVGNKTVASEAYQLWKLLNSIQMEKLLDEGRVYGGLHKLEPNELVNVKADIIQALLPADVPEPFVQHMLFEAVA